MLARVFQVGLFGEFREREQSFPRGPDAGGASEMVHLVLGRFLEPHHALPCQLIGVQQLPATWSVAVGHAKMVAQQQQERLVADPVSRAVDRVAEPILNVL